MDTFKVKKSSLISSDAIEQEIKNNSDIQRYLASGDGIIALLKCSIAAYEKAINEPEEISIEFIESLPESFDIQASNLMEQHAQYTSIILSTVSFARLMAKLMQSHPNIIRKERKGRVFYVKTAQKRYMSLNITSKNIVNVDIPENTMGFNQQNIKKNKIILPYKW